jgi:hypothetical protein
MGLTANYVLVLDTNKLFQPKCRVAGVAAKEPVVKTCAEWLLSEDSERLDRLVVQI